MVPSVVDRGMQPAISGQIYGKDARTQDFDLYRPSRRTGPFPVFVYVHGGGFRIGFKGMASATLVQGFLDAGFAVASVDYRLSVDAKFPAAVQDVFAAVAYLKLHASTLDIDPAKVVMFGESAGANIASLVGTAYDDPVFRKDVADSALDLRPAGVIALYPPVNFSQIDAMLRTQGCEASAATHNNAQGLESLYLGAALPDAPNKVSQADPSTYATRGDAPFFIQNGDQDCFVGSGQASLLSSSLKAAGVPVTYEILSGAGHGGPLFETPANIQKIGEFLTLLSTAKK